MAVALSSFEFGIMTGIKSKSFALCNVLRAGRTRDAGARQRQRHARQHRSTFTRRRRLVTLVVMHSTTKKQLAMCALTDNCITGFVKKTVEGNVTGVYARDSRDLKNCCSQVLLELL